jgi:hypothetical protein
VLSEINVIKDIKEVIEKIDLWKAAESNLLIDYEHYKFAPYATIIYINDKIYYTPNMPYEKRRKKDGDRINPHPTMCILRKSALGMKLEELFEFAWKKANEKAPNARQNSGQDES